MTGEPFNGSGQRKIPPSGLRRVVQVRGTRYGEQYGWKKEARGEKGKQTICEDRRDAQERKRNYSGKEGTADRKGKRRIEVKKRREKHDPNVAGITTIIAGQKL